MENQEKVQPSKRLSTENITIEDDQSEGWVQNAIYKTEEQFQQSAQVLGHERIMSQMESPLKTFALYFTGVLRRKAQRVPAQSALASAKSR